MRKLIWIFIVIVTVADAYFTWACQTTINEWESNPVAAAVYHETGASGAIAYRAAWLSFAGLLARSKARLSCLITPVWGLGHLYLLVSLIQAFQYLAVLHG